MHLRISAHAQLRRECAGDDLACAVGSCPQPNECMQQVYERARASTHVVDAHSDETRPWCKQWMTQALAR
eukprot:1260667-Pleurochrysis_carterae.AAC.2